MQRSCTPKRFLGRVQGRQPWSRPQAQNPFWQEHFSFLLSFCDRKRKKKPAIFSTYPEKHPGGVFFNISLKTSKINFPAYSLKVIKYSTGPGRSIVHNTCRPYPPEAPHVSLSGLPRLHGKRLSCRRTGRTPDDG